jgi:DNA modification methylase
MNAPWTLHEGDCLEWLKTLDPGSVDAVVTDPPYGVGIEIGWNRSAAEKRSTRLANDQTQEAGQAVLDWAAEQGLPTVAFASPMKPWAGEWRQHLVWDKGPAASGLGDLKCTWKRNWELIQVARNGPLLGKRDSSVLAYWVDFGKERNPHPTMKPVSLMGYLVRQLVPPGGLIVDPFAGSGSTGVAAIKTGRRFLGCEIDPRYAKLARRRMKEAEHTLFPAEVAG